ncbi:MAG: FIST C-terminal domain-containing protein [Limnohabitans sp.]|nr:FIST C-terminal domain-containing protein [Limnohabitans sp.]
MNTASYLFRNNNFIENPKNDFFNEANAQLVLGFGNKDLLNSDFFEKLKSKFPNAQIALCSTAGEIFDKQVFDNSVSISALYFEKATLKISKVNIENFESSFDVGKMLVKELSEEKLKLVFVLSDGAKVNGSELVKGFHEFKSKNILVTGGLAGDGTNFKETIVGLNEVPQSGNIVAIGFYGDSLQCSHGSIGGWETFGLERIVTKSDKNILYEIDSKNALDLYKTYLGKYTEELPSSALLFPLAIINSDNEQPIVRTILSIDEEAKSMTFAGDIPEGSKVRFMKANFDKLIDAASNAASNCLEFQNQKPQIALLISCVGRKIILSNRIDEEVEAVAEIFGEETTITGFYSYGEISPLKPFTNCELHNQTMTITGLNEIV